MDEKQESTDLEKLRKEIAGSCPILRNDQIVQLYRDYGVEYFPPDTDTFKLISFLASAEKKIMEK